MKKIVVLVLAFLIVLPLGAFADNIPVYINGEAIEFDVQPAIINDRTMVPMRKIFETLGADIEWIPEPKMIFATKGAKCVLMQIGAPAMAIKDFATDDEIRIELDTAPVIVDDRTLVPLRAVSEAYGMNVEWNDEERAVYITDGE